MWLRGGDKEMHKIIMNTLKIVIAVLCCAVSISVVAYDGSSTIYANINFPKDYYLNVGQSYQQGDENLTYKMAAVAGQNGLFASDDQSILYVEIVTVTDLPNGLSWTQHTDTEHPANNLFYLYGTVPVDITPGVYQVKVQGQDGARRQNKATQVINLHIISIPLPQPTQATLAISGTLGATLNADNTPNISQYFRAPNGAQMEYKVVDTSTLPLPSNSISLNPNGEFQGRYRQVGVFPNVQVVAKTVNQTEYGPPLTITFTVTETPPIDPPIKPPAKPPLTLTCPTVDQLRSAPGSCPAYVDVADSAGNSHRFEKKACNGLLWDFHTADLRNNASPSPNGLSCSYLTSGAPPGVGFVYTLESAPVGTYYGSSPSNTADSCSTSVDGCKFNIPQ
jgi:hypothetical protein